MRAISDHDFLGEFEQLVLLAVVRLENEAYGMSIRREIEARCGRGVSIGAVYATVERLLAKGYLEATAADRNVVSDARARRFYVLTSRGAEALETSRALQARMWAGVRLQKAGKRS